LPEDIRAIFVAVQFL